MRLNATFQPVPMDGQPAFHGDVVRELLHVVITSLYDLCAIVLHLIYNNSKTTIRQGLPARAHRPQSGDCGYHRIGEYSRISVNRGVVQLARHPFGNLPFVDLKQCYKMHGLQSEK